MDLKCLPCPPKSMLSVYMMTLGPWHSNLRQFKFFQKKMKNLIFLKKIEMKLFCLPPTPQYQCWPYPRSRTPYDQH